MQTTRFLTSALTIAASAGLAHAIDFTGSVDNDWFKPGNWSSNTVPTLADFRTTIEGGHDVTALIDDSAGATLMSDGLNIGYVPNGVAGNDLPNSLTCTVDMDMQYDMIIGWGLGGGTGSAIGRLYMSDADITMGSSEITIGYSLHGDGITSVPGDGILEFTNGTISDVSNFEVGKTQWGTDVSGVATLTNMTLSSAPSGFGDFEVGYNLDSPGFVTGLLTCIDCTISNFDDADIGYHRLANGGGGGALGAVLLDGSEAIFGDLLQIAGGDATGQQGGLSLTQSFVEARRLQLGAGASIRFEALGLSRASAGNVGAPGQYGAIDITGIITEPGESIAELAGEVVIVDSYNAQPGDTLDLITLRQPGEVFTGAIDRIREENFSENITVELEIVPGDAVTGEILRARFVSLLCDGDANGDSTVDVNDISYVLFRLGQPAPDGDANGDGAVDVNDISYVLFRLGNPCP